MKWFSGRVILALAAPIVLWLGSLNLPVFIPPQLPLAAAPVLGSISPDHVGVGSPNLTLTLTGSGFTSDSVVKWTAPTGPTDLATTFVDATKLTALVPVDLLKTAGEVNIAVSSPDGVSAGVVFKVLKPAITSLNPYSVKKGSPTTVVTVNGAGFLPTSQVVWAVDSTLTGIVLFISDTQLNVVVDAAQLAVAQERPIKVVNSSDTDGVSEPVTFNVSFPELTSISPAVATTGANNFALTVNGSGFCNDAVVYWKNNANPPDEIPLATVFVSETQLRAAVTANLVAVKGTAVVRVKNPTSCDVVNRPSGTSDEQTITILPLNLSVISPLSAPVGGDSVTLAVRGTGFSSVSQVVLISGTEVARLATSYIDSANLSAVIPSDRFDQAKTYNVYVENVIEGGGRTVEAITFQVKNPSINDLTPKIISTGSDAVTVVISGQNFLSNSEVYWGVVANKLNPSKTSTSQLEVTIPASWLAIPGPVSVWVRNPSLGTGGESNKDKSVTVQNAVPVVTSFSPSTIPAASAATDLTIIGEGFIPDTKFYWNDADKTTWIKPGSIQFRSMIVTIPKDDLATGATVNIKLVNPSVGGIGGGTSVVKQFTIGNPAPTLTEISPTTVVSGGAAFTLTVKGTNFVKGSKVRWSGTDLTTTFKSSTELTASVPSTYIASGRTISVTVFNAAPGGGTTAAKTFTVTQRVVPTSTRSSSSGGTVIRTSTRVPTRTPTRSGTQVAGTPGTPGVVVRTPLPTLTRRFTVTAENTVTTTVTATRDWLFTATPTPTPTPTPPGGTLPDVLSISLSALAGIALGIAALAGAAFALMRRGIL